MRGDRKVDLSVEPIPNEQDALSYLRRSVVDRVHLEYVHVIAIACHRLKVA